MLLSIVVFLVILSILVLIHEAGHFFVAKKMGVKVEEFGFGFPPRLFGKKYGETLYSFNLLPIGGFVKLYGEDEAGGGSIKIKNHSSAGSKIMQDKRSFISRPAWQRFLIVIAGVVMNFLLAVVIVSYLFAVSGVPIPSGNIIIAQVAKNSPAEKAGLKSGDTILLVDNKPMQDTQQLIAYIKKHAGKKVSLQITHHNTSKAITITLIPRITYPKDQGAMGVAISQAVTIEKYPWYQAPFIGITESAKQSWVIVVGLGSAITQIVTQGQVPEGLAGPVGIAQVTNQFVQAGFDAVLSLMAMLSLNLAVLNILPIPALDGGRLFFILYEMITRKKVHPTFESYAHAIGMVVLLFLIVLITIHDLFRIFTHQPLVP